MESLKSRLNNYKVESNLEKSTIEILVSNLEGYETIEEEISYIDDIHTHGCVSGIVGGLIYRNECKEFFINNMDDIMDLLEDLREGGQEIEFNIDTMVWIAFEITMVSIWNSIAYDMYEEERDNY